MTTPSLTRDIAAFVVQTPNSALPIAALELGRRAFADTIGVAIAGSRHPTGRLMLGYVAGQGSRPIAGVLAAGMRTSPELAALANGTLAHILDFDDTNHPLYGHPSCHLVPAVLAVGDEFEATYLQCLGAYLVGFEVDVALARGMNTEHYRAGFHATATIGTLGACAAAARLMGLDEEKTVHALGIASSRAAGLRVNVGTMTKPLHAGTAAMNGVQAAHLAAAGWQASTEALESPLGFCATHMGSARARLDQMREGLGVGWSILEPFGLAVKPFPSCGATHPAIQAAIALHRDLGRDIKRIVHVRVGVSELAKEVLIYLRPATGSQARFSLEYVVAVGLAKGRVGLRDFEDESLRDPIVQDLITRIHPEVDERHRHNPEFAATLRVELEDGRVRERTEMLAKGKNASPMSEEELLAKFTDCVGPSLPALPLWNLVRLGDGSQLAASLVAATWASLPPC